jgi:hypothetical protein
MPGSRFKEFIDRAFLGNRGYNYQTGEWNRDGVRAGLIGGIGNAIVPGLGTAGRMFYERHHNGVGQPTQYGGDLGGQYYYTPWTGGINNQIPGVNTGYNVGGTGLNSGSGYTNWTGGINGSVPPIQYGTDGGMTQVPLDTTGGYTYQGYGGGIDRNLPGIRTGSTGGHSTNGGGGLYTSGTLGGGSVVDPSQWGAYGLGGDSGPDNGGIGSGYALQLMSGGMHEGGGQGLGNFLAGKRVVAGIPRTGGALPPNAYGKTGGGGQIGG